MFSAPVLASARRFQEPRPRELQDLGAGLPVSLKTLTGPSGDSSVREWGVTSEPGPVPGKDSTKGWVSSVVEETDV